MEIFWIILGVVYVLVALAIVIDDLRHDPDVRLSWVVPDKRWKWFVVPFYYLWCIITAVAHGLIWPGTLVMNLLLNFFSWVDQPPQELH